MCVSSQDSALDVKTNATTEESDGAGALATGLLVMLPALTALAL